MTCSTNIVTANFGGGKREATTAPLYQWDYGQVLCIAGLDALPQTFEVHFATQKNGGVSTTVVGIDGRVDVPNVLLTIGKDIHAWIYLSDTTGDGETEYAITIPVKARPMPEYYDAEATGVFDGVVRQVGEYAEEASAAAERAATSASAAAQSASAAAASEESASESADRAEYAMRQAISAQNEATTQATIATEKASQASGYATAAAQSATSAEQSKTAAANAATAAGQAASAAGNSAATATTKATDAAASASDAAQSATAATTASTNAAASATDASASATAAAASATAASGSAQTASTAAQTATTKAAEASASATAAEAAKNTAVANATTATEKAAEAAQSASGAAQSKTDAEAAAARAEQAAASLTVDSALSDSSTNPVQNKVITGELTDVKSAITLLDDAVFDKESEVLHEASSTHIYSNGLNNAYVWMLTTPFPQHSIPKMTIYGTRATAVGMGTIYFLKKNADETYSVVNSTTITTVVGANVVTIPQGITDENDIYVGFYSVDNCLAYNSSSSSTRRKEYTRFSYANPLPDKITASGKYMMDFNVAIEYETIDSHIADLQTRVAVLESSNPVIVDANGNGDYTSVLDAMQAEPEGTVIFIKPGVYNQDMTACMRKRVILIGADRNQCIIRDTDGRYGHHPLYISCGYFSNLTIEAPFVDGESQTVGVDDLGAYAVHIDTDEDYAIGKQCEFHHCNIRSDFFPAVGLGMRKDATYIFDDCTMENGQINGRGDYSDNGTLGALYFHDSNGEQGDQYLTLKNCVLKSKLKYAMCPYMVNRTSQNNRVYCNFISNVLYSDVGHYTDTVWFRRDPFNPDTGIFSIGIGYGNSISTLNNA